MAEIHKEEKIRVPYALAVHSEEEEKAVLDVLREHKTIMGERTRKFESAVAAVFGKKYGVMVNSGSSANLLALELLNAPEGSEIITPVLTFATTVAPILHKRLKPIFVDVEPGTYQINVSKIREKITSKTKALMIPSLIGNVPDMEELRKIVREYDLAFIEDSCDTLGATFNGLPTGVYSDISTTSFYGSHVITACGGGGMICFNRKESEVRCKMLRGWGRSSAVDESEDLSARFGIEVEGIQYDTKFIFGEVGYNFLPMEVSAAFGLEQLKKLKTFTETRIKNFSQLDEFFLQYQDFFLLPKQLPQARTNWLAFPLTLRPDAPFSRSFLATYLEENNIQTRPVFTGNILRQPAFRHLNDERQKADDFPVADNIMRNALLIGCHHGLTDVHIDYLKKVFTKFLDKFS
jgi:CDP-6-deoxy-D-xylo-4-hexulose-3-dehydrase